jgi:DNA primase
MSVVRSDVEEIKKRANIVDIVSEYVTLKKSGVNYTGLCPFHKEKTPSFSVNADKQIFYCFGCGEGGDAFAFLMKVNNMTFPEALRYLAGKLGIVLSQESWRNAGKEQKSLREEIYKINRLAADYFSRNLFSEAGKPARIYLQKRRLQEDVVKTFRIGYSLQGWRGLKDFFQKQKVSSKLLEQAGLVVGKDSDYYDRFRGRLMFPIEGMNESIIAFGGRSLGDELPKYLNSPESPVYVKGRNLYGLARAKGDIRKKDEVVIVEGYFDFLQLWNAGIRNVVATLGTALTRDHLDLLHRYTKNVVAIFDPDEAGRNAVERSLKLFVAEKMHATVVVLPEGFDPDSFVLKKGKDALEVLISEAQSIVDYYIDRVITRKDKMEDNLDAVANAVGFITQIEDMVQRNLFIKRVSERLGIDQELLKAEICKNLTFKGARSGKMSIPSRLKDYGKVDPVELSLIHLLMERPDLIPVAEENRVFDLLSDEEVKPVGLLLCRKVRQGGPIVAGEIINGIDNEAIKGRLLKAVMEGSPYGAGVAERFLDDTIKKIKQKWNKERRRELQRALVKAQEMKDANLSKQIAVEKEKLIKEEKALSLKTGEK